MAVIEVSYDEYDRLQDALDEVYRANFGRLNQGAWYARVREILGDRTPPRYGAPVQIRVVHDTLDARGDGE